MKRYIILVAVLLLLLPSAAIAQDGCTIRIVPQGVILDGCNVVLPTDTATPEPEPTNTETATATSTETATAQATATLTPVVIVTSTPVPPVTPVTSGLVANVPLIDAAAGDPSLDANNWAIVTGGDISPGGGYWQTRLVGNRDGLRIYVQVMQPVAGGTVQFDVAGHTFGATYPSTAGWTIGARGGRGWSASRTVPWAELGGLPSNGDTWPLQIVYGGHDWTGTLRWGLPDYGGRAVEGAQVVTLPLSGDATVGGGTDCGAPAYPDYYPTWGALNWGDSPHAIAQAQWDTADWPCYARYYAQWSLASLPAGAQVVSATVTMRHFGNPGYGPGYAPDGTGDTVFQVYEVAEPWDELGISWDNAPPTGENTSRTTVLPIDVTCPNLAANAWYCDPGIPYTFDVTEIVRRAQAGGRDWASMGLYTAAGQYHSGKQFWSREGGGQAPVVRIAYTLGGETWTPTPIPNVSSTVQPTVTPAPTGTALPVATASFTPSATPTPTRAATATPVTPVTPSAGTIDGFAVLGDSFFDEYRGSDNRGGAYAATTFNLVEILQRLRGFDLGAWGTWGEPRRTGYEYVWARSGATSATMIQQNQHIKAAVQIAAGDVSHVLIGIGANDFSPKSGTIYRDIYNGTMSDAVLAAKVNKAIADVTLAVQTVQDAGAEGVLVTLFTEWSLDPQIQASYPDAAKRARVDNAINAVNAGIRSMASARGVVVVDQNAFGRSLPLDAQGNLTVGGQKISFTRNGDAPNFSRLADGQHIGTVVSGIAANVYFVDPLNTFFGASIPRLTDAEILSIAGLPVLEGTPTVQPATPTRTPTVQAATATPSATIQPGATPTSGPVAGCTRTVGPADSLTTAVGALKPGDVLCLRDGTYTQSIEPRTNGTQANPITIRAINDGRVTIDGGGVRRPVALGSNNQAWGDWFVIEGLVLRNGAGSVLHVRADNNVFRRISVHDADTNANSTPLLLWGSNNTVEDCLVSGTGRFMVDVYGGGGVTATGNTVRRCVVMWDGWDGRRFCGVTWPNSFMMGAYNSSGGTYENNLIYGRGVYGLILQANTSTASASNNAVLGNIVVGMGKNRTAGGWEIWDYGTYPNRPGPTDDPYDDTNCDNSVTPWTWPGQRSGLKFFGQGTLQGNIWRDNLSADNAGLGFAYSNPGGGRYSGNVLDRLTLINNGVDAPSVDGGRGAQAVFPPGMTCTNCRIGAAGTGGARLTNRYIDRTLTSVPLLPWPMESRAMSELNISVTSIWQEYVRLGTGG